MKHPEKRILVYVGEFFFWIAQCDLMNDYFAVPGRMDVHGFSLPL